MIKSKIEKEFNIRSIWLPFGYEETTVDLPEEKDEILRACFIGNPDKFRADLIMGLAENGVPLTLFGNNWDKWISLQKTADIHYHPAIYKNDFNETATRYRVQLNSFRPHNENSHNMRTFEMPGLGCIMVAPKSDEHEILFKDGKEVLLYKNKVELVTQTLKILNLDYESAMQLRHSALTRSMNSGYSYKARTKKLLGIFETVLNER